MPGQLSGITMVEYYVTGISKTAGSSRSSVRYKLLDFQHASPGLWGTPEISPEDADGSTRHLGALPWCVHVEPDPELTPWHVQARESIWGRC